MATPKRFTATVDDTGRWRAVVRVPFNPDASSPEAAAFFAGLATFYRKGYLRWIDGASRRPEIRAQRVRELVTHLEHGRKERPR